jgi:hypothetical protein
MVSKQVITIILIVAIIIIGIIFLTGKMESGNINLEFNNDDFGGYDFENSEFNEPSNEITNQNLDEIKSQIKIPENEIQTNSDGTKFTLDPKKVRGGGPQKGGIGVDRGIPALAEENIKFVSVKTANQWIQDDELVLFMNHKGDKRIYPLQILIWHEIANDVLAGDPIAVTYCPLCGSGISYYRVIDVNGEAKVTRFGTSGKLYNSNLIMYDEETDTYWQQIDGNAIIGELTGHELQEISVDTVTWRDIKKVHPDSSVLSKNTGMSRNYGQGPYGGYFESDFLIFPVDNEIPESQSIKPKDQVLGIEVNGEFKAYKDSDIKKGETIEDIINGVKIKIEKDEAGITKITNLNTGEEIVKEVDFWFAWYAFHPETDLYES